MEKQIFKMMALLLVLAPSFSFAKVSDFHNMIEDNMKAQKQLHETVQTQVEAARIAARVQSEDNTIVADAKEINVPTKKGMLVHEKEKTYYRASEKKQMDRLASEFNESEF